VLTKAATNKALMLYDKEDGSYHSAPNIIQTHSHKVRTPI
jgi:hypothetical protein